MTTELDPSLQQRVITLAEAYPARWEEVLDGRTEARSWFIGMTAFGLDEDIDRKAVQAWIDKQVDTIRHIDKEAAKEPEMLGSYSRMPIVSRLRRVSEAPVEDVMAMAVVEGTLTEVSELTFITAGVDVAQGNHVDPDKPPRAEIMVDTSDPENLRVVDVTRTHLLPDGSLSIVTTPVDPNDAEEWVTLDMKSLTVALTNPASSIKPTVTLTKSELAKLLEQAFAEGVGCDERYESGADNQLACVTDILDDVLFEGPTRLEDMTPEQREHVAGMTHAYISADSAEAIAKLDAMDLRPGGLFELPPTYGVVYFEHLAAFMFDVLKSDNVVRSSNSGKASGRRRRTSRFTERR